MNTVKKITNPVPVLSEMSSSFSCCLSAVLFRINNKRYNPTSKSTTVKMQEIYGQLLTASGLGFSYVFKDDYLSLFHKTEYYTAFANDQYINYAMNYGNCNYKIISASDKNIYNEICNSIDKDIPVLAEGLTDLGWSLITGYDDLGQLYGFSPNCVCCTDCVNCIQRKPSRLETSEFILLDWINKIKRIVVITDFNADKFRRHKYIEHWLWLMEQKSENDYSFGANAVDSMIKLLEDDTQILNFDDKQLKNLYRCLYTNSFIPEYRFYVAKSIYDILEIPSVNKLSPEEELYELANKIDQIRKNCFESHKVGWNFWTVLSEKGVWQVDSNRYASLLRNPDIRQSALKELAQLKEIDDRIKALLKDIHTSQYLE